MSSTDGVGDYRDWADHATSFELEPGLTVQIGSASDLLMAKEQAGRPNDLDALPLIRAELLASGALAAADVRGPVAELAREFVPDPRVEADEGPLLGDPPPRGSSQADDRAALDRQLTRLRLLISRAEPSSRER